MQYAMTYFIYSALLIDLGHINFAEKIAYTDAEIT